METRLFGDSLERERQQVWGGRTPSDTISSEWLETLGARPTGIYRRASAYW